MSADEPKSFGVTLGAWFRFVRRARFADPKKRSVALTVGSYADTDGSSVKCGVARLAVDCEMGFSTARRYLAWLRQVGLIELVRVGNRKARRADEYRLSIGPDTETALNALSEEEYRDRVDGLKTINRAGEKERRLRSDKVSAESDDAETDEEHSSALAHGLSAEATDSEGADEDPSALSSLSERRNGFLRSPMGEPPPPSKRSPPTGGAPPPDPRRPEPPTASGARLESEPSLQAAHHPAQDQQGESLPHARAREPAPPADDPASNVIRLDDRRSA